MKRGDYDYQHATSGHQFIAVVILLCLVLGSGLVLGLALLTSIL
jgi:hypothetical protein